MTRSLTRSMLTLAAGAALLAAAGIAEAQTSPQEQRPGQGQPGSGMPMMSPETMQMMMQRGGMGQGMGPGMEPGMMQGMRHGRGGPMLGIVFAVMDADGDGALSLAEVQDVHARIFRAIDADDDGSVTQAELRGFLGGAPAGGDAPAR